MQKLRKAMVAVASAAMVLGTMGLGAASAASSTTTCVSRAQFIYAFDVAAGIAPVYPATSDFSDVASSSPYYGYIEAAFKAGYINGTGNGQFSPSGCLTRGQIAKIEVLALGDGAKAAADATSATTFTDDSSIPSWARGYVVEAVALGLVHGYPDGSFAPNATMTATDEGYFLTQYKTTENALSLTVTASASDVGPGQQVTLTATGTSEPVTFSTTSGAVISGATFIGSTPGTYTVTGATASGLKGTATISVYGAAVGLKINAPTGAIVANNASLTTVTVDVVDANGNTVANANNDNITINGDVNVLTAPAADPVAAVNGVATFTFTNGSVPGTTDSLTATDSALVGYTSSAVSVSSTAQVPTSLTVTAPTYVGANSATPGTPATVEVDDQTGSPMLTGTYAVSLSLTGPALFTADNTTGPESGAFVNGTDATFPFTSIQSETGAITFTASATGLTSGTATTTAVIAGTPTAIQLTADPVNGTSFAESASAAGLNYSYQVVDSHGYPVGYNPLAPLTPLTQANTITVLNTSTGLAAANIALSGWAYNPATGAGTITVDQQSGSKGAGTYTLQVADPNAALTSSAVDTFTETAGAADKIALTGPAFVGAASPSGTYTAQVTDASGNPVAQAGIPVSFDIAGSGGTTPTVSAASVNTDASGAATVTATAQPYTSYNYLVGAYSADTAQNSIRLTQATTGFQVESTIGTTLTISTTPTVYTSGGSVTYTITVKDAYGNPVKTTDAITVTYSGSGALALETATATLGANTGTVTLPVDTATTAGTVTVTAQDTSVASTPSGSATIAINADTTPGQLKWLLLDAAGKNAGLGESVSANTPVKLTLEQTDASDNLVVTSAAATVDLNSTAGTGAFRLTPNGSDVSAVSVPAGSAGITVYYVDSAPGKATLTVATAAVTTITWGNPTLAVGINTVTVKDQNGNLMSGVTVTFTFTAGTDGGGPESADGDFAGSMTGGPTVVTGSNGTATITYNMPTSPDYGTDVSGGTPDEITATAGVSSYATFPW